MTAHGLIFFLFAGALGIFSFAYFTAQRDAAKKARVWPFVHVAAAAIVVGYLWGFGWPWWAETLVLFGVLLTVKVSLSWSRFCPGCSDLIYGAEQAEWEGKCPNCGVPLSSDQDRAGNTIAQSSKQAED